MGFDVVFILFVIRLMATLLQNLGIDGGNFPRQFDCDFLGLRS